MKIKNKYYIGATHLAVEAITDSENSRYLRPTLDAAIEDARDRLAKEPQTESVIIVKIIRVVTRKELPVNVVKVE